MEMRCTTVATAIGDVVLATRDGRTLACVALPSPDGAARPDAGWEADPAVLADAALAIRALVAGEPAPPPELDRDAIPGTPFQRAVWDALETIPCGETRTYGDVAVAIGKPGAVRAVGAACGANPLPLVRPCHRVVAASGLGGFAGGLPQKQALLVAEGALLA